VSTLRIWESDPLEAGARHLRWSDLFASRQELATAGEAEHERQLLHFFNARDAQQARQLADFEPVVLAEESDGRFDAVRHALAGSEEGSRHAEDRIELLRELRREWNYDECYFDFLLNHHGRLRREDEPAERVRDPTRRIIKLLRTGDDVAALRAMIELVATGSGPDAGGRDLDVDIWAIRLADVIDHADMYGMSALHLTFEVQDLITEALVDRLIGCSRRMRSRGSPADSLLISAATQAFAEVKFSNRRPTSFEASTEFAAACEEMGYLRAALSTLAEARGHCRFDRPEDRELADLRLTARAVLLNRNLGHTEYANELLTTYEVKSLSPQLEARAAYLRAVLATDIGAEDVAASNVTHALHLYATADFDDADVEHADALHLRGVLALRAGQLAVAATSFRQSAHLRSERLGPSHRDAVDSAILLAVASALMDGPAGLGELRAAIDAETKGAISAVVGGDTTARRVAIDTLSRHLAEICRALLAGWLAGTSELHDEAATFCYRTILVRKGISSDVERVFSQVLDEEWSMSIHVVDRAITYEPNMSTPRSRLRAAQRAVDRRALGDGDYELTDGASGITFGDARDRRDRVERRCLHPLRSEIAEALLDLLGSDVLSSSRERLGPDELVIDFVRLEPAERLSVEVLGSTQEPRYIAFAFGRDEDIGVRAFDLGPTQAIDLLVADFRDAVVAHGERDLQPTGAPRRSAAGDSGTALRHRLLDPMASLLVGSSRLTISPDGDLWRLPFDCLPGLHDEFLLDELTIRLVPTVRDIARRAPYGPHATAALVLGGPDFDHFEDEATDVASTAGPLAPLPGARQEAVVIADLLGVTPLTDAGASKIAIMVRRSPVVLHVATHAYYLSPAESDLPGEGADRVVPKLVLGRGIETIAGLDDPFMRAGIALSGANRTLLDLTSAVDPGSGLLTARDVMSLDLRRTQVAVLSACDTGLGLVVPGESVAGLPRALLVAGASTVVMSLWKVADESTSTLMQHFYGALIDGQGGPDALRTAKLRLMKAGRSRADWGAFICYGEATPLQLPPTESAEVDDPDFEDIDEWDDLP